MKEKIINIYKVIIELFAFGSSVYCMNLLLIKIANTDSIGLSFFICIFLFGAFLNLDGKDND